MDFFTNNKIGKEGHDIEVISKRKQKGEIEMPEKKIDVNQLNQAKANVTLTQSLLTQAIEKAAGDPTLAEEAIKQASNEIAQAQTAVSQVQSGLMAQKSE